MTSWGEYWPRYLADYSAVHHRPATTELLFHVGKNIVRYMGRDALSSTNDAKLDRFAAHLSRERGLKNRSINIHLAAVGKSLRVALRWKLIRKLPFTTLSFLSEGPPRIRFLDGESRSRLLDAGKSVCGGRYFGVLLFFLCSGLRRNELKLLTWEDVDLDRGVVSVQHPKAGRARSVPLPLVARQVLHDQVKNRRIGVPWVFYNTTTQKPYSDLSHTFKRILRKAGLEDWHLHDLRHAYATHLAEAGATTGELMELLGHSSAEMVRRYAHLSPLRIHGLLEAIDGDFADGVGVDLQPEPAKVLELRA